MENLLESEWLSVYFVFRTAFRDHEKMEDVSDFHRFCWRHRIFFIRKFSAFQIIVKFSSEIYSTKTLQKKDEK